MKKIISLLLALVLCTALAVPAMATTVFLDGNNIPAGNYYGLGIDGTVTIKDVVTINTHETLSIYKGATLIVDNNGLLKGSNCYCNSYKEGSKIILKYGGRIDISFAYATDANAFELFLKAGDVKYSREDNTFKSGTFNCKHKWDAATGKCTVCEYECPHDTWNNSKCSVCQYQCKHDINNLCDECINKIVADNETNPDYLASTLSEGSLTFIVGVACLAVGFIAAMFIFKKKKPKNEIHNS